jgi:hypothetical protein
MLSLGAIAQPRASVELIHYLGPSKIFTMGPIVKFQNAKNWYIEGRYNYEALQTASVYVGKAYSKEAVFSYSIVPIVGGVAGRFKGGSVGLNLDLNYKKFFLSSQSQYTVSSAEQEEDFFFSWTELGYEVRPWFFAGLSMQPTCYTHVKQSNVLSPGFLAGFSVGQWTVPFYVFDPFTSRALFVCSIVRDLKIQRKK